jgi:Putative Actinobacterial Holin-X, holin superfamily III
VAEETADPVVASPDEGEEEQSVTELLEQFGRQAAVLAFYESRLTAARHEPELRTAARGAVATLGMVAAFLTALVLANTAALLGLATVMDGWLAALVLAAAWTAVGTVLALALCLRVRRLAEREPMSLEEARDRAEQDVRRTLEELAKAITKEIALAAVPMAGGLVEAGEDLIESADEIVDSITEELPGGGVVNQVWDVFLAPGRFGVRVATTVLKRGS